LWLQDQTSLRAGERKGRSIAIAIADARGCVFFRCVRRRSAEAPAAKRGVRNHKLFQWQLLLDVSRDSVEFSSCKVGCPIPVEGTSCAVMIGSERKLRANASQSCGAFRLRLSAVGLSHAPISRDIVFCIIRRAIFAGPWVSDQLPRPCTCAIIFHRVRLLHQQQGSRSVCTSH